MRKMHDRDCLHRFMFEQYPIRGHLVHLDAAWRACVAGQPLPVAPGQGLAQARKASRGKLGWLIELYLQISNTTLPGVRSLFITTLNNDRAVATGMLEVK